MQVRRRTLLISAMALGAALLLPQFVSDYYVHIMVLMLIGAVFAMSLDLLMGYAGLPSLGHAAFLGMGAYGAALTTARYGGGWLDGMAIGIAAAMILAAIFGFVALRVRGLYFLLITLALAQVLWGAANRWGSFTGGYNGLRGFPKYLEVGGSALTSYYTMLPIALALGGLMYLIVRSPFGLSLQGLRDSESRVQALGYHVWLHKYVAFILSALFAGCAGVMSAFYKGFVSPFDLSISVSAEAILMVILGGTGTLVGPVIGAVVIVALRNMLSVFLDHWLIVLGAIFVATVFVAPRGVIGWFTRAPGGAAEEAGEPIDRGKEERIFSNCPTVPTPALVPSASDAEVVLSLDRLTKAFGGMLAVRNATFEVRRGERVAILGPNGAGKSSLFNLVSGHLTATRGQVSMFGSDVSRLRADQRARAGLGRTFQITNLFPTLTVIDNVRISLASAHGRRFLMHRFATSFADSERGAERHLKDAGLWSVRHRLVQSLSYGEQRQLEFVMALALGPRLLLLDEPTAGLSRSESRLIVDLVHRLDRSLTLLIIEHDLDVALAIAERVIVFHFGEQIAEGTPQEIRDNPMVREIYLGALASAG